MITAVLRKYCDFSKLRCFNYESVFEFDVRIIFKTNPNSSF